MALKEQAEIKFSLSPEKEIVLTTASGVFMPTATTSLLIHAVQDAISEPVTLLDLGCGSGVVGLALYLQNLVKPPLHASDLSEKAVRCSHENFKRYKCPAEVCNGSLFDPWLGKKFELIIDDISGVAQDVAIVSPWFKGVPCETGKDGTGLVVEILRQAPSFLADKGRLFFPALSLSNTELLVKTAKENFREVEMVARQEWPLPAELKAYIPLLRKLNKEGSIRFQERFGMVLCYTEIYSATNH